MDRADSFNTVHNYISHVLTLKEGDIESMLSSKMTITFKDDNGLKYTADNIESAVKILRKIYSDPGRIRVSKLSIENNNEKWIVKYRYITKDKTIVGTSFVSVDSLLKITDICIVNVSIGTIGSD